MNPVVIGVLQCTEIGMVCVQTGTGEGRSRGRDRRTLGAYCPRLIALRQAGGIGCASTSPLLWTMKAAPVAPMRYRRRKSVSADTRYLRRRPRESLASASRIAAATVGRGAVKCEDVRICPDLAFLATRHVEPGSQAWVEGVVRVVAPRGFVEIVAATDQGHALLRREGWPDDFAQVGTPGRVAATFAEHETPRDVVTEVQGIDLRNDPQLLESSVPSVSGSSTETKAGLHDTRGQRDAVLSLAQVTGCVFARLVDHVL